MRRNRLAVCIVMACAVLVGCSTGSAPLVTATPAATPTQAGTRVAFVSTLVARPTDTPSPPTPTPVPTATRVVNTITALSPAPTRVAITVAPRVTSTPNAFTGATTSTPTGGTREYIAPNAGFRLRYPEMWMAGPQGSTTVAFSPERGNTRFAGFLIEPVTNPTKNAEQDLRDNITMGGSSVQIEVTKEPYAAMVDGKPAFRADLRLTVRDTGTPSSRATSTPTPTLIYTGSLYVVEYRGAHYRIGVFARDGDAATLMQAEEILASLRFT